MSDLATASQAHNIPFFDAKVLEKQVHVLSVSLVGDIEVCIHVFLDRPGGRNSLGNGFTNHRSELQADISAFEGLRSVFIPDVVISLNVLED